MNGCELAISLILACNCSSTPFPFPLYYTDLLAAHSNIPAWETPRMEEPSRLQSAGSQNSPTELMDRAPEQRAEGWRPSQEAYRRIRCHRSLLPQGGALGNRLKQALRPDPGGNLPRRPSGPPTFAPTSPQGPYSRDSGT